MRKFLGLTIITGVLLLLGSTPCLADSGSGATITTTITVTGNSGSSGSSGWNGWSTGTISSIGLVPATTQPRRPAPFVATPPVLYPPSQPAITETPPAASPPVSSPTNAAINWGFVLAIAVLIGAIGLLIYLVIRMRKKAISNTTENL
jgi:hypothetical protein